MLNRASVLATLCLVTLSGCQTHDDVGGAFSDAVASLRASLDGTAQPTAATVPVSPPASTVNDTSTQTVGYLTPYDVTDGDTIKLTGKSIRLHGIDAPELDQQCEEKGKPVACGQLARQVLIGLTTGVQVLCHRIDTDRYGRDVSRCLADGFDIEDAMVSSGYAVAYREYSLDYVDQEATAKLHKRGMWRGTFQMPWDWRAFKRQNKAS
jgi:endonuclease YncB( thermonuclease family)